MGKLTRNQLAFSLWPGHSSLFLENLHSSPSLGEKRKKEKRGEPPTPAEQN